MDPFVGNNYDANAINTRYAMIGLDPPVVMDEQNYKYIRCRSLIQIYAGRGTAQDQHGNNVKCNFAKRWLEDENRRVFKWMDFLPHVNGHTHDTFNLWHGFAVKSEQNEQYDTDIDLFQTHIKHVWANGDEKVTNYVLDWFAYVIQKRTKPKVALVVQSDKEQVGKGIVLELFEKLLTTAYCTVTDLEELQKWSDPIKQCLIVNINEAFFGGSHKMAGFLKTLITDASMAITKKGMDTILRI